MIEPPCKGCSQRVIACHATYSAHLLRIADTEVDQG